MCYPVYGTNFKALFFWGGEGGGVNVCLGGGGIYIYIFFFFNFFFEIEQSNLTLEPCKKKKFVVNIECYKKIIKYFLDVL